MSRITAIAILLFALCAPALAASPDTIQKLYDQVSPSLVAVQYTWDSERGRQDFIGSGIVVTDDGLVMCSLALMPPIIPDKQMHDFKVIVPSQTEDPQELDATFQGRDERTSVAFFRTKEPQKWHALKFEDAPLTVGQEIISVGLLPKSAGYKCYAMPAAISALLRGEVPQVLATSGLAGVGAPVLTPDGKAIGLVNNQAGEAVTLNDIDPRRPALTGILFPARFFIPAKDFLQSLQDPPAADKPIKLPWIGLLQMTGLTKDVAEVYKLKNQPAVQIGDVIPDSPADKAGLKSGSVIVKFNGDALERGDEPEELPMILRRKIMRMKVGDKVTLSVLTEPDQPLKDVSLTLEEQPKRSNLAKRYFAEDLGFTTRELVFLDTYLRKLPKDTKGVLVDFIKPQSSAQNARLENGDLITELNSKPVTDLDEFKKDYEDLRKSKPKEAVVLVVQRREATQVIRIEPPQ